MALATFHSFRGEHSALIAVKQNNFEFGWGTFAYVPKGAIPDGMDKGDELEIPDGYKIVDMVDLETGEIRTSKEGEPLKVLAY